MEFLSFSNLHNKFDSETFPIETQQKLILLLKTNEKLQQFFLRVQILFEK